MIEVRKYSARVQISRDEAIDLGIVEPTPEEKAAREAASVEFEERRQAATAALPVFVAALDAVTDPVARAVLDLHKADNGWCVGDDFSGYEGEPPAWPCRTVQAVAAALGIPIPPDLDLAEQARP